MKVKAKAAWSKYRIEKGGIYNVIEETQDFYFIECNEKIGGKLQLPKKYAEEVNPDKFNLRALALTIKYLELSLHNLYSNKSNSAREAITAIRDVPIEYYYINELKLNSAFCHTFRNKKAKLNGKTYCICPLAIFKNSKYSDTFEDGCITCRKYKGKILSDAALYKRVQNVEIETIMKYLKKIKISKSTIQTFKTLYYHYVKLKVV